MATAKKLPSGSWRVQAYATIDGKSTKKSFTGKTAKEAERLADEWQTHTEMLGNDSTSLTVEQAINEYIKIKEKVLSSSTILGYKNYLKNGYDDIKKLKLYQLSSINIQKSINKYADILSPKSLKNYYGLLFATIKMFYPELVFQYSFPKKVAKRKREYSKEYIVSVLKSVENSSIELPVLLAITLSMRAGEIAGLKWEDVDFDRRTIFIHRVRVNSDDGYIYKDIPKTDKSTRTVYINDLVYNKLKSAKEKTKSEFVTTIKPNQYWRMLKRKTDKAGIESLRFHDLRHINASIMLSLGINNQISQEIGGWSTDNIMKSVYQHAFSEEREEANQKLNKYFLSLENEKVCQKCNKKLTNEKYYLLNDILICSNCFTVATRDDIIKLFKIKVKQP